jgi:hypothetical protein
MQNRNVSPSSDAVGAEPGQVQSNLPTHGTSRQRTINKAHSCSKPPPKSLLVSTHPFTAHEQIQAQFL